MFELTRLPAQAIHSTHGLFWGAHFTRPTGGGGEVDLSSVEGRGSPPTRISLSVCKLPQGREDPLLPFGPRRPLTRRGDTNRAPDGGRRAAGSAPQLAKHFLSSVAAAAPHDAWNVAPATKPRLRLSRPARPSPSLHLTLLLPPSGRPPRAGREGSPLTGPTASPPPPPASCPIPRAHNAARLAAGTAAVLLRRAQPPRHSRQPIGAPKATLNSPPASPLASRLARLG